MSDTLIEAVARAAAVQMTSLQGSERSMDADLTPNERKFYLPIARAAIAAIEGAGYRIVPVVASAEMWRAWISENHEYDDITQHARFDGDIGNWLVCYFAMLAAAPKVMR